MNEIVQETKESVLESLLYQLREIEKDDIKEIYFHDIVSEDVDTNISGTDRQEQLELIDLVGTEYVDQGIVDNSSLDRMLITTAYDCLYQELFNDDFMQELQTLLNNEKIDYDTAQEIIEKIEDEQN